MVCSTAPAERNGVLLDSYSDVLFAGNIAGNQRTGLGSAPGSFQPWGQIETNDDLEFDGVATSITRPAQEQARDPKVSCRPSCPFLSEVSESRVAFPTTAGGTWRITDDGSAGGRRSLHMMGAA